MKALFLIVAFGLAAACLRYQTDLCHSDCLHDERPAAADSSEHHGQCDGIGCQINTALDTCDANPEVQTLAVATTISDVRPLNPWRVYPEAPFHPPKV